VKAARSTLVPVSINREVAVSRRGSGKRSLGQLRLTPIPTTTKPTRVPSISISVRMPDTLRPPIRVSLGHLSAGRMPPMLSTVSATATPATSVSREAWAAERLGLRIRER
jgi:hypothetical protein